MKSLDELRDEIKILADNYIDTDEACEKLTAEFAERLQLRKED